MRFSIVYNQGKRSIVEIGGEEMHQDQGIGSTNSLYYPHALTSLNAINWNARYVIPRMVKHFGFKISHHLLHH